MRADIHDGQEHERSVHGPDTEAQDQSPLSLISGLQHTAGPYRWVMCGRRRLGKNVAAAIGRVRSCVRPVCAVVKPLAIELPNRSSAARTKLSIVGSGEFGMSPFFGQL
jgi:hypothetical protein